jgi:hypothetical protein
VLALKLLFCERSEQKESFYIFNRAFNIGGFASSVSQEDFEEYKDAEQPMLPILSKMQKQN